jgi:hypothetical protein
MAQCHFTAQHQPVSLRLDKDETNVFVFVSSSARTGARHGDANATSCGCRRSCWPPAHGGGAIKHADALHFPLLCSNRPQWRNPNPPVSDHRRR